MKLTYDIREDEIPPCDEGPDFSNCHIAIKICRARLGHPGAELSVAQAGQHGGQSGDEEAEDDGRSRLLSGDLASEDVDASAQRGAHSQSNEVQGGQAAGELGLFTGEVQCPATQQVFAEVGELTGHVCCDCVWVRNLKFKYL